MLFTEATLEGAPVCEADAVCTRSVRRYIRRRELRTREGLEDWIVTNPPEQQGSHTAVRWCEQAIRLSRVGAALLVRSAVYPRLSQMAEDHCIARYALQQRPEFGGPAREGKGPGARYDYDFLIFSHLRLGPAVSRRLSWR